MDLWYINGNRVIYRYRHPSVLLIDNYTVLGKFKKQLFKKSPITYLHNSVYQENSVQEVLTFVLS